MLTACMPGSQKKELNLLEFKFQMTVTDGVGALQGQQVLLTTEPSIQWPCFNSYQRDHVSPWCILTEQLMRMWKLQVELEKCCVSRSPLYSSGGLVSCISNKDCLKI